MSNEITFNSEEIVTAVCEALEERGFQYDEDFTALYSGGWRLTGIEFMGPRAEAAESYARQWYYENCPDEIDPEPLPWTPELHVMLHIWFAA